MGAFVPPPLPPYSPAPGAGAGPSTEHAASRAMRDMFGPPAPGGSTVIQKDGYQVEVVEPTPEQLERMVEPRSPKSDAELLAELVGDDQPPPDPVPPGNGQAPSEPETVPPGRRTVDMGGHEMEISDLRPDEGVLVAPPREPNRDAELLADLDGDPLSQPATPAEPEIDPFDIPDRPPYEGDARGDKRHTWQDQGWVEYLGTIIVYYHIEAAKDFFSGRMAKQLLEFFKAIPAGVGKGVTGTWDTFKNTYYGWRSIVNDPAVLGDLDDATVDMVKALDAQVQKLDYYAQTNDPRFGEAMGELTGQALFDTATGRVQDVLLKKGLTAMNLTRAAANAAGDAGTAARAANAAPEPFGPPLPTNLTSPPAPLPTRLTAPPPPMPGPLTRPPNAPDLPIDPAHHANAQKWYPHPATRATRPVNGPGTPAQVNPWGCSIATLRGILAKLGYYVPDEAWLVELARSMGLFSEATRGLRGSNIQRLLDKLTELRMIPKVYVDVFEMASLWIQFGNFSPARMVQWLQRYFPDSPIWAHLVTEAGGGHAVQLEKVGNGLVSIGDPALPGDVSILTGADLLDKKLFQIAVVTPENKPRPPAWIARIPEDAPLTAPQNTLLKPPDPFGLAFPLTIPGTGWLSWPAKSFRNLAITAATGLSIATVVTLGLTFLLGGGGDDTPASSNSSGISQGDHDAPEDDGGSVPVDPNDDDPDEPGGNEPGEGDDDDSSSEPPDDGQQPHDGQDPPDDSDPPPDEGQDPPPDDSQPPPDDPGSPPDDGQDPPDNSQPPPDTGQDPPDDPDPPEQPAQPLASGTYNGTFIAVSNGHPGSINPPGTNIIFYRYFGTESGMAYYEFVNLFGGYASNLVLRGGPFPPGAPFSLAGTADFLNGAYPGVPVTASGSYADGALTFFVQIGGTGLPFGLPSSWNLTATRAGDLPATLPAPAQIPAPIINTQVQFRQIISELEGNCGNGPGPGADLSPQTPTPIIVNWANRTLTVDDSLPSPFDPFTGFAAVRWADGRGSDVTMNDGLTGTSAYSPFPGCTVHFDTTAAVVPGQPPLYPN